MALSGGAKAYFPGNSNYWIRFAWTATQNIAGNYSTITLKSYFGSNSSWSVYANNRTMSTWINGVSETTKQNISTGGGREILLDTRTLRVDHNADGTKSFNIALNLDMSGIYISGKNLGYADTKGVNVTLNTIPRASTLTSSKNFTALYNPSYSINRASNSFTHWVGIKHGSTTITGFYTGATNGTIYMNKEEEKRMLQALNTANSVGITWELWTYSDSSHNTQIGATQKYSGTMYAPSASSANLIHSTHNIGDVITFGLSSSDSRFIHSVKFIVGGWSTTQDNVKSTDVVTFNTATYRQQILQQMGSSNKSVTLTVEVTTRFEGIQVRKPVAKSLTLNLVGSAPTPPSSITYKDASTSLVAITGTDQALVDTKSKLLVNIGRHAVANDGATLTKYVVTCGSVSKEVSPTTTAIDMGTVTGLTSSSNIQVRVYDSRGAYSDAYVNIAYAIPYSTPTIQGWAQRKNNWENETSVQGSGNWAPMVIEGKSKNALLFSWSVDNKNYNNVTTHNGKIDGTWLSTLVKTNIENTAKHTIYFRIQDKFVYAYGELVLNAGIPMVFYDTNKKSVGFGGFPTRNGVVESHYPLYSRYLMLMGSTDTSRFCQFYYENANNVVKARDTNGNNNIELQVNKINANTSAIIKGKEITVKETAYGDIVQVNGVGVTRVANGKSATLFTATSPIYPADTWVWTSPVPLTECPNGWRLVFSDYVASSGKTNDWDFYFVDIDKGVLDTYPVKKGIHVDFLVSTGSAGSNKDYCIKKFKITNTTLQGYAGNGGSANNYCVLREIVMY